MIALMPSPITTKKYIKKENPTSCGIQGVGLLFLRTAIAFSGANRGFYTTTPPESQSSLFLRRVGGRQPCLQVHVRFLEEVVDFIGWQTRELVMDLLRHDLPFLVVREAR